MDNKLEIMTISAIKKEQHEYIDRADDNKLKAMHTLLEKEVESMHYSSDELKKFYDILDNYESGNMETFPVDIAHNELRASIPSR